MLWCSIYMQGDFKQFLPFTRHLQIWLCLFQKKRFTICMVIRWNGLPWYTNKIRHTIKLGVSCHSKAAGLLYILLCFHCISIQISSRTKGLTDLSMDCHLDLSRLTEMQKWIIWIAEEQITLNITLSKIMLRSNGKLPKNLMGQLHKII